MTDNPRQIPQNEYEKRIERLKQSLYRQNIDAALIIQKIDMFYFCGTLQQGFLYVPVDSDPVLLIRKSVKRAQAESKVKHIVPITSAKQIFTILGQQGLKQPKTLGLELDVLPAALFLEYQKVFAPTQVRDISTMIRMIRAVKSDWEIHLISRAAQFADKVSASVKNVICEGMTELELAGEIESVARKMGHQGLVRMRMFDAELFYGHLMAGNTAAIPSYLASPTGGAGVSPAMSQGPSFNRIRRHEPVLVDYVFVYEGYIADHTRIFSMGALPDELIKAHRAMLDLETAIKTAAKPGVKTGELYESAIEIATEKGYQDYFMGADENRIRFVGHGVGLELDEFPFLAKGQQLELVENMVIALEPKLIFPDKGVVGIENTHVVTSTGLLQLTCFDQDIQVI